MKASSKVITLPALIALFSSVPGIAHAHLTGGSGGFESGLSHPLHGLDHILAMVAVGLWAAQLGGRALWIVPASFVGVMVLGGALGHAGVALPLVEPGITASIFILGILLILAVRVPVGVAAAIVGLFAVFHGFAHGAEAHQNVHFALYALGFVLATAVLHGLGVGVGLLAASVKPFPLIRVAGVAIVAAGVFTLIG